jgi:hypothetical protein
VAHLLEQHQHRGNRQHTDGHVEDTTNDVDLGVNLPRTQVVRDRHIEAGKHHVLRDVHRATQKNGDAHDQQDARKRLQDAGIAGGHSQQR